MDQQGNRFYEFGSFRIDTRERLLFRNGELIPLPPKVYDTLLALVENSGHTIAKEELMKTVWPDSFVEDANLSVNISALRKALGGGSPEEQHIETVPRRGYKFVSAVTLVSESDKKASDEINKVDAEKKESVQPEGAGRASAALTNGSNYKVWVIVISALVIGSIATIYYFSKPRAIPIKIRSIAVLPFKPLVLENRDEPLEVGMCDALITRLAGLSQFVVRPTSSVLSYNKSGQDPLAAGRELGVDALLDGHVQRSGDRIRVTVQLLSVADGKHLWSGQFNENFTNIFAVEDSISEQMVTAILSKLTGAEQQRVTKHHTENIEAYQLYLKGRYFQDKRTPEGLNKSIEYFEKAIEQDPGYALAFAGLADSYVIRGVRFDMAPKDSSQKAKTAVMRALELDDTIAEAHASLANLTCWYDWDWLGAEREFKRASELNLNTPFADSYYATYLITMGRNEEAVSEMKQVQRLAPLSLQLNVQMARILYFARDYDQGIEQCQKTLELDSNVGGAHQFLGRFYNQKRLHNEALTELQRVRDLRGEGPELMSLIGYTYAVSGRRMEAERVLKQLAEMSNEGYVSPYHRAMVYAGLGDRDKAFEFLEKAYEDREGRMTILKAVPEFDGLRSDSRYADLIRRIGLP